MELPALATWSRRQPGASGLEPPELPPLVPAGTLRVVKRVLTALLFVAAAGAVAWLTRDRLLPVPERPSPNPPPFRRVPEAPPAPRATRTKSAPTATADDLRRIKGIGPVYAGRLGDLGVDTFSGLIAADSEQLAADLDVSVASVVEWKTQATAFLD